MLTLNKALTIGTNCIFNKFEWKSFGVDLYANVLDANGMAHIAKVMHKALVETKTPYTVSQFTSLTKFFNAKSVSYKYNIRGAENSMIVPIFNNIPETEYTIGVWFWELEDYFPWGEAYNYVDEVWCFSQFCKDIFKKYDHKGIPIHKFVYAPETNIADSCSLHKIHNMYGINPHKYTFLYTFDYFGSIDRKNPLGTIDAFRMAFGDSDDVQLIIKTMSGGGFAHDKAFFERYINGMKNVVYIDEDMDKSTYIGLINACDCYVSLHRSEGLGIGMIEAMYLGKPVIATAYGGSMEFTNPDCTLLVNYTMQHTMTNLCYYSPSATWAEPNIQKAASYMQLLVNNRQCGQMIGKRAQEHIYTNFNQAILNKQINTRLQWIKNHWNNLIYNYILYYIMAFYFHAYTDIPDVKIIYPKRINDERGWFMESYVEREFLNNGIRLDFIQENHSCSQAGVFRGLHYQRYPYDQGKLVRCTHGSLTDYFMDMRKESKTFGKLGSYKLTANNSEMIWVPRGFAHGIHILEDDTEIMYKVDNVYAPTYECGVNPLSCIEFDEVPLLSEKDKAWPDFENAVYFS